MDPKDVEGIANIVHPDQEQSDPHQTAPDLGLHCLPGRICPKMGH